MGYVNRIRGFFLMTIDVPDLIVRLIASLIFLYIVRHNTQQQIIALGCLIIAVLGIRKINKFASIAIDKFEHSKKGTIPGIGSYDVSDYKDETVTPKDFKITSEVIGGFDKNKAKLRLFGDLLFKSKQASESGQWELAAAYLDEASSLFPENVHLKMQLAVIYGERIGTKAAKALAINYLKEILKIEPKNISAKFNLAVYTNHLRGAVESLPLYLEVEKQIISAKLEETEIGGKLNIFIGHDLRETGKDEEARVRYNRAITILEKLADGGDKTAAFWLKDAKTNLSKLDDNKK